MAPKLVCDEQKGKQMEISSDVLENIDKQSDLWENEMMKYGFFNIILKPGATHSLEVSGLTKKVRKVRKVLMESCVGIVEGTTAKE